MGFWQVPLCAEMKFNELRSSIFLFKKALKTTNKNLFETTQA